MQSNQPLVIHRPGEFLDLYLYPRSPLVTSFGTQWQNIELIHMRQPTYEIPEVCNPWHTLLILPNSASTTSTIDGIAQKDLTAPGDMMIIPANVGHGGSWASELEMIVIGLHPSLFTHVLEDATNFNSTELVPHFATPDPLVHQLGLSLKTILEQNPIGSRLYAETTAAMLSVHLLQRYGQQNLEFKDYTDGLPRGTLRQVTEYIDAHLDQELGLAELAAISHLSLHYFARLFKKSTGVTPHQFVIRCRVNRAKTLLLAGKGSISAIAQQVGFANQAHLNVHVKRLLGVTPKMILEQRKNQ